MTKDERERLAGAIEKRANARKSRCATSGRLDSYDSGFDDGMTEAFRIVREWPTDDPATGWIGVDARMPEPGVLVLVVDAEDYRSLGHYRQEIERWWRADGDPTPPSHWMSIPIGPSSTTGEPS